MVKNKMDWINTHKIELFGITMFLLSEITVNFFCDRCRPGLPEIFMGLFFLSMFALAMKSWVLGRKKKAKSVSSKTQTPDQS